MSGCGFAIVGGCAGPHGGHLARDRWCHGCTVARAEKAEAERDELARVSNHLASERDLLARARSRAQRERDEALAQLADCKAGA